MESILKKQENKPLIDLKAGKISYGAILIGIVLLLVGFSGFLPPMIISLGVLTCCALLLLLTDEIYLVFPVMLFYGYVLGVVFGISVYRIYTLILIVQVLLKPERVRVQFKQLLVLFLFAVYCFTVVLPDSLQRTVFTIFDMLSILLLINRYLKDPINLKRFFTVFVICGFLAYFTGLQQGGMTRTTMISGEIVELTRNTATFEDPNYMGFFYTCAIFATVALRLFSKPLRVIVVIALYAILLTSLSISAILLNVFLWLLYLLITRTVNWKVILVIFLVMMVLFGLYLYGLEHPNEPTIGLLSARIEEKLNQLESGDINDATTNRAGLYKKHFVYFTQQPVHKMLIGMNAASTLKTDLNGSTAAGHNEYIDWLLNVGIIGTVIMLYYLISTTWSPLKKYLKNMNDRSALSVFMIKCVWIVFAFSLTLYGDYRFMLMLLL